MIHPWALADYTEKINQEIPGIFRITSQVDPMQIDKRKSAKFIYVFFVPAESEIVSVNQLRLFVFPRKDKTGIAVADRQIGSGG